MSPKNKKGKKLTSTIMALAMTVTTTFQMPIISMASEIESSVAVESQIEEGTSEESVSVQSETTAQTNAEQTNSVIEETSGTTEATNDATQVSDEVQATVAETTAEVTYEEEKTTLSSEVDPSGEDIEESKANETRGPDETIETTTQAAEEETSAEVETESESETTEESTQADPFASLDPTSGLTEEQLGAIDFSSKRLLVAADESVIIDPEHVLSDYAGVYLMQYDTETQAKYAYAYYYNKSEFVDVDTVISVADGDGSANAAVPMAAEENPIAELQAAVAENPVNAAGAVAVIDTGVNDVANVTESVSMIGDNTADENGHGTRMAQLVAEQNPDVSILSIKALGADGTGDISAVYAAIRYAIDKKASVINLSMSAVATAENAALTSIIDEATAAGIAVVGAAGNKGMDVRFFVPGNIESAYIIGAADEDGARITSSNYGSTVDFNVHADSTSEAAAKFSGYYTVNGAVADEKLVFPTDYSKPEVNIDFNGPIINHQISYYNYEGSSEDLVWVSQKTMKTVLEDDYITTYIGFAEDADLVSKLNVYVDFMSIDNEHSITDECIVDLEKMTVKIPASYKNANLTVRWFMPNASYSYGYDVDAKYMISNTPEKFKAAYNGVNGLTTEMAQQYVAGTYAKGFTHTSNSMNHSYVNYATDGINVGDWFTIQSGYIASVEEYPGIYTTRGEIASMFGPTALANLTPAGSATTQTFLSHFNTVTRDSDGSDVSGWFNTVGGKGNGVIHVDVNNSGSTKDDEPLSAGLGWVFGTCANDEVGGQCPSFTGGKIICTSKDPDGTAYFFFYCTSPRGQWTGGSFSITPKLPKTGFLQIHKSSADPAITNGNSCYNFEGIPYGIFTDAECRNPVTVVTLDANGYSQPYELTAGTYYVREAEAKPGSGYQTNSTVYTIEVTAGTTATAPVMCETTDVPLNDPFGIVINKINADGTTTADLSGAEYTIKYYPKQYNTVAEIQADPEAKATTWVIKTIKDASGNYQAFLDDAHIVSGVSDGAKFGKNTMGTYIIPLGTLTVEETKAPTGFTKDGAVVSSAATGATLTGTNNVYLFQFVDENSAVYLKSGNTFSTSLDDEKAVILTYAETQNRAGIKVVKYDIAKKGAFDTWDGPQGLASLKGIRFAIINKNGDAVKNSAGKLVPDGGVMQVLTTDKNGYAATGVSDLPTGKYLVKELRKDATVSGTTLNEGTSTLANDTYMWADNSAEVVLTDSDKNSLKWAPAFYNSPVSAVPKFEKHDLELGKKAPMAGTSMAGIIYGIYNDSDHPIKINGKTYKKDEVIQRIYADKDGNFTFTTSLPYGHYYVKEGENLHYIGSTTKHYFHVISKDGKGAIFYEKKPGGSETDRYDSVFFSNRVIRGDVSLTKKNGETNETLAYIPFRITNNATGETHYILTGADGSYTSAAGKTTNTNANDTALSKYGESDVIPQSVIDSLTKDAGLWFGLGSEGTMTKANNSYGALVYGTYTITELKTEATTSMDMYSYTFEVKKDGKLIDLGTINNYSVGIQTTLADANGSHTVEAGKSVTLTDHVAYKNLDTTKKYTLTGTLYAKDNDNLTKLMEKTVEFTPAKENGTQDVTFTFDASTLVGKSVVCFEELFLNGELRASHKDKNDHNQTVTFPSVEGIPVMEKHDLELNKKAAMGGTSFEGITFEIYNDSEAAVLIDGNSYQKGEIIATAVSDAAGTITTNVKFPAGRYSIKEKSVNNQYTLTDEESHTFTVSYQNGKTVVSYESGANAVIFKDRVVRGDMSFVKKNSDTGEALAYVPFRVTNNTTGETHYILTGADGTYTSAARKTINTNANDAVLSKYGDKDVIPQSVVDSLAKDAGLWFGMGSEGTMTAANDSYGSFVYGTYTITELKTEATRNMKMYTSTFTIDTDGKVLDLGTVNNVPMGIKTTLVDVNEEHFTEPVSSITLTDHVAYKNLDTDKTYTLTGTLYVKEGDALTELMTETVDFTPAEKNGIQDVTFTFDASALKGKSVVAFEELSVNGEFCAEHKDKDDENQTVTFPDIQTTARDNVTEDHVSNAADSVTIIDTVTYTGLKAGETYEITGTLMDAETGEAALDDDGNAITASKEFTAPTADGNIDITFTFAGVSLAGKTLVAFEDISYEGRRYAVHADINDKNQTVYIPKIHTKALDANTGLNQVLADSNATVVDTVTYTHLLPGKTYVMKGVLMTSAGNALMVNGKTITASTEFVPTTPDGTVDVTFNFDASEIGGRKLVFYEYLELDGNTVASHTDISDTDQTVYVPKLRTTIFDSENGSHNSAADEDIILIDTVRYNGVEIGRKYTVVGTLVDKETGNALLDDAGNKITASNEFVAEKTNGTIDVTFKFSGKCLAGKTTVAFEDMYSEGKKVAVHADLRDEGQTEYFPSVHTTATSNDTEDHVVGANEKVTITDQVALKALKLGTEYTLSGTLMNAKTGKPIMVNGNTITARRTFTADAHEMTIPLTYTLNASELAGTTTVVFENLYSDGALLAAHADLEDEEQTVYIPEIHTTAKDQTTKINHTEANKTATIVDTVSYTNLLPGREYTVSGTLMDKETGKAVLADGKEITASTTFTPEKSEGSVDVIFTFDASIVAPKTVVAFETLTYKKIQIAVHADIEDKDQTVYIPTIRTSAKDNVTGINHTEADKEVTITDTVTYKGLEVGREYTVSGTLMNQRTGAKILVNGKPVTASTTFTAEEKEGSVEVVFTFDATALEGTTTVVFETLYTENKEVAAHTDINDKGQTIYIPKIRTTAISDDTNDHVTKADEKITLIDTVAFTSLEVGREYTVTGKLMDRAANKPILVDGKEVTAQTTFVPETTDGTVDVTFTFDGTGLEDTVIVVFETLYTEKKEVAVHADITDEEQSVYVPEIHTKAEDATTEINHTEALPKAKIVDTVSYSSLLPGKEYTMTGTLMNKKTGEPILIDGNPVTSQVAFMAEKPEGSVKIVFLFDASVLAGTTVVAFESLTYKGVEVAVHADIEDKDQTVYIPEIHTTAVGEDTKDHVTEAKKDVTIVDTVSFKSLEVGREYTVKGVLMDKSAEKTLLVNGEEVTAETTFVPETTDGTVDVTFTFDGTGLEDTLLVAFETLYTEEKEVGVHAEIEDDAQTVYLPKIQTEAKDAVTEIDHTEALPKAKIIDTVSYSSLLPGKEYTVTGTLMNKETKEPVLIDGEKVTASTTFTAEKSEGSVEVVFEFDASAIAGTTVVAFESMEYEGVEVAVHADIEDEDQTVYIPDVHTTATAANTTHDHVTGANEDLIITDEVVLTGLKIGNEYTVKGVLMDKSTGEELKVNDESITAEETFTADAADMIITLTYTLDATTLAGTTTVVFETLYTEGKEVGRHHEIDDEGQTVYIPEIHTTAKDQTTKINHTEANDKATIVDTVYYSHLLPGKEYTVHGKLMDKKTGEPILIDDKEITASTTFTAEKSEGSVDVIFTFDASILAPKTVVAFEYMEYEGIEIAVHADIDDEDQTVYIPKIHTTAVGEDTQDHIEKAKEEAVIVDTVSYEGLEIGREYTVAGKLMDKETGEPILVNGEEVTASETFTAETEEGGIDITFTFDSSALAGKSLVAFETLYTEEKEVAVHADITDEGQTVRIPEIHTTATDKVTGDHDGVVAKETTVLDEVFYTNLIPGKEYTVSGKLMVKETGEPLTIDGKEVTAEKTFVAEEADGSIILEFTFDSSALAGKKIVAFEDVTYEGISIGTHEDLTDEDQTISYPEIHTTAADQASGSKTMTLGSSVTLVDTVTYKGLTAGKTYVVKGTIMDKASGETIGVTAETTFTAEAADGSVEVTFTFDTTQLQGKTLVVFETLYDTQGNPIVAHSDLNDEDQTVSVPVQPVIPPVVTGDDSSPMPYVFGLAVAVLIAMAAVVILLRKRKNQK